MTDDIWVQMEIPSGWTKTTIDELCDVVRGGSPRPMGDPRFFGGSIPFIKIADVTKSNGITIFDAETKVTEEGAKRSRLLEAGRLILSNSGTVCVPIFLGVDACIHDGFVAFDGLSSSINQKFLFYFFKYVRPYVLSKHRQGVTQVNLNTTIVGEMGLLLPPEVEQRRIVDKIEELFSELDKGAESLKRAREQLKVYRQTVLNDAASGQLLVQRGFRSTPFEDIELTTLEEVVNELGQGWSPRCLNHPSNDDGVWGVIKTTAIQHLAFDDSENKELPEHLKPRPHLSIEEDDILVTRAGPRKRVGVACLVRSCRPRLMLCDKAYRLRSNPEKILPEYLEMLLNSPRVLAEIEELKTGINDSGVNLTQARFLSLQMPVPSIADQNRTLAELSSLLSNIESAEAQITRSLEKEPVLRQTILKKAFSGQLVEQAPSDAPASVLLERIKAEKAEHAKKNKKKKKEVA